MQNNNTVAKSGGLALGWFTGQSEVDFVRTSRPKEPIRNGFSLVLNGTWLQPASMIHVNVSVAPRANSCKIIDGIGTSLLYRDYVMGVEITVRKTDSAFPVPLFCLLMEFEIHRCLTRPRKIKRVYLGPEERRSSWILRLVVRRQFSARHKAINRGSRFAEQLRRSSKTDINDIFHVSMIPSETSIGNHSIHQTSTLARLLSWLKPEVSGAEVFL